MARSMERINENICRMTCNYKTIFTTVWTLRVPEGVVLIDAASYDHDAKENILPFLEFAGVAKEEIRYVFITHNHTDHAGGLKGLLQELPGVTVVSRSQKLAETYPDVAFIDPADGEMLTDCLQVIAIPGHTADCAAILDKRTNTLLCGDCLQLYGIVGNEDWACNIRLTADYFAAVEKVRAMKVCQLLTAHDYYPTGYRADGEAAVEKALDDCLEPLKMIGKMIRENPELDDEAIRARFNAIPGLPTAKLHVVSGIRKAGV